MKMVELDKLYQTDEEIKQKLQSSLLDMQDYINKQYDEKIYKRIEPQITRIQ